jgi:hypothetical protein
LLISFARNEGGEVSMNGTAARLEADKILAELPDRISDVIKPFVRQSPDHPALVQGNVTWTYAELAGSLQTQRASWSSTIFVPAIGS